ncbi:helix-turn-helix domain-containing protein, partial [Escherichia coli]|nr:Hin recombinase [Escherichia coli]EMA8965271.1 Hin recombinase [Escherichia coli]
TKGCLIANFATVPRGAYRGRKKSLSSERIAELRQRVEAGEQKTKLAREFGISRETLYQYLRTDQ